MTEDEIVGWHYCLNGHEFEKTLGDSEGQVLNVQEGQKGQKERKLNEFLFRLQRQRRAGL